MTVLYLTYDGMCDHIAQSQVTPYLLGLAERGWSITVVSHEKREVGRAARVAVADRLRRASIAWLPQRYLRAPALATLGPHLAMEVFASMRAARREPPRLVHARSYVPAAAGTVLRRMFRAPLLFDMRGFWFDEKVDAGSWRDGPALRVAKRAERGMFAASDAVVSLTETGRDELETWPEVGGRGIPVRVIPTSVDLGPHDAARTTRGARPLTVAYVGSFGARYLTDAMVAVFAAVRARVPDARMLVLATNAPTDVITAFQKHGVPESALTVDSVPHHEVATRIADVDATFSLVKSSFATLATCPTKFGESLAAGAPVVVNAGVGDCASIVRAERVGVVASPDGSDAAAVADRLLALVAEGAPMRERCRAVARARFDLRAAVDRYDALYRELTGDAPS